MQAWANGRPQNAIVDPQWVFDDDNPNVGHREENLATVSKHSFQCEKSVSSTKDYLTDDFNDFRWFPPAKLKPQEMLALWFDPQSKTFERVAGASRQAVGRPEQLHDPPSGWSAVHCWAARWMD